MIVALSHARAALRVAGAVRGLSHAVHGRGIMQGEMHRPLIALCPARLAREKQKRGKARGLHREWNAGKTDTQTERAGVLGDVLGAAGGGGLAIDVFGVHEVEDGRDDTGTENHRYDGIFSKRYTHAAIVSFVRATVRAANRV